MNRATFFGSRSLHALLRGRSPAVDLAIGIFHDGPSHLPVFYGTL